MKRIIAAIVLLQLLSGCNKNKVQLCDGKWVLVKKWVMDKKENFKPSAKVMVMEFKEDGTFKYYDSTKEVGYSNTYNLNGNNLKLHFEGITNQIDATYKIGKIDKNFLFVDTSLENNDPLEVNYYIFVKEGSGISKTYEGNVD